MAVGSVLLRHRIGQAIEVSNSVLTPATSRTVKVLPQGGQVNGTATNVNTCELHTGHGFVNGQKFMLGTDESTARTLTTVSSNGTTVVWSGGVLSPTDGDVVVNLGADSLTGGTPDYDDTTVAVYTSTDNAAAESPSDVVSDSVTGEYEYWTDDTQVWEVVLASGGTADTVVRDVPLKPVDDVIKLNDVASASFVTLADGAEALLYLKDGNLVIKYNDGGTVRYKSLDLVSTGTTWAHATGEPS